MTGTSEWTADAENMVRFAVRWAPFGGGDTQEIFSLFGVDDATFFARLSQLLTAPGPLPVDVDDATRTTMVLIARKRLAASHAPESSRAARDDELE